MRVHFIAIGGAAMHNMAIALHKKGFEVSGSDDEIFDPSKSKLEKYNLLPSAYGWFPEKINDKLDAIILGMHARKDNPELLKAQELGLKIFSYPEYIYSQCKDKTRVVIGGSHGKTSITAMVLHVLNYFNMNFDYMVGAQLDGFETMVKLSDAPIIILEGDEYLSSPIDLSPKFLWYKPHIAVLTGIAWDHINVFPTFENYVEQFDLFAQSIEEGGYLFYNNGDKHLNNIALKQNKINCKAYDTPNHVIDNGITYLIDEDKNKLELNVFGEHNLQNIEAAKNICFQLGISYNAFNLAIGSFSGAAKRLEKLVSQKNYSAFKDFAHSPSKLKATVNAVKGQFKTRKVVAAVELHTFSSLNKKFLGEYAGTMDEADIACVYYSHHTIEHKKLEPISEKEVKTAFQNEKLHVFTSSEELQAFLKAEDYNNAVLLLMSSGNFDGVNLLEFAHEVSPN